jgi:hypothetical protein
MAIQTATNPETGERLALVGGQWQPVLQSATNDKGVKAFLVGDKWLVDEAAKAEARANVEAEKPKWAKEFPKVYEAAVKARQLAGPTVEMLGTVGGGALGAGAGALAGPVGVATGAVGGAGLGYGISREALEAADVALGLKAPRTANQLVTEPVRNVLTGATMEAGGRVAGPIIEKGLGALGRGVTSAAGVVQDIRQLPNRFAAEIARKSFETPQNLAAGQNALRQAIEQGSRDTAAQILAQQNIISPTTQAGISEAVKRTIPAAAASKEAAKEISRKSTLTLITPDIEKAIKLRAQAADPLYKAADEAVASVDDTLKSILDRMPKGTLESAKEIAKIEGKPFPEAVDLGQNLTGQQMHYIKRALADKAYGPEAATGLGQDAQRATRTLLNEYLGAFESKIPQYGEARQIYSEMTAPINQAQVLKEMVSVLEKPGGGERIGPFLNVLGRGEQAMLKRAGGRGAPRYEALSEVLTPEQITAVRTVADSLKATAEAASQIPAGQRRFAELIKDEIPNIRIPNVFNIFATTTNKALSVLDTKLGKKTMEILANASQSAQSFDDLLNKLPATERNRVLKVIRDPNTWKPLTEKAGTLLPKAARGGALAGVTAETPEMPTNAFAPEQPNQNALAR